MYEDIDDIRKDAQSPKDFKDISVDLSYIRTRGEKSMDVSSSINNNS